MGERRLGAPAVLRLRAMATAGGPLCRECRAGLHWLSSTATVAGVELWAPLGYSGPARAIVTGLKFGRATGLAGTMAAQIVVGAPARLFSRVQLVPVPLHPARRRRRGFDQAELLADAVAVRRGLIVNDCLRRTGSQSTQVGRTGAERRAAMESRVVVRGPRAVPARALLVDDVDTTGATLAACAAALRGAGSTAVAAVAYARTPGR